MGPFVLWALLGLLALALLPPVVWAWRFVLLYPPRADTGAETSELPRAAVILCLRGADPSLRDCLRGLLRQDYPRYALWVIVDSREDAAWGVVQGLLAELGPSVPVHVRALERPRPTCSLKLSAQLQALAEIDEAYEAVALIDADVVPGPDWLRALVAPLRDPKVGATTGARWYAPVDRRWGTLARYLWNAFGCVQAYTSRVPWGGSLAFRTGLLRSSGLLERWSHSFCEDTSSSPVLRALGLRLHFVPAATSISREPVGLKGCLTFCRRQLVCVRLYHPSWPFIAASSAAQGLAVPVTALLVPLACLAGWWPLAGGAAALLLLASAGLLAALFRLEGQIARLARARGQALPRFPLSLKAFLAMPLAQLLHPGCLVAAWRTRRIDWRGITYELARDGGVRLLGYRPYQPDPRHAEEEHSIL